MSQQTGAPAVAIVGGGLAGLTAAAYLARAGRKVRVYEKASELGGRARAQARGAFTLNLGPHAVYRNGKMAAVLRDLGVPLSGGVPGSRGAYAIRDGRTHALPGGFVSLLSTSLLSLPAKLETARLLSSFPRFDASRWARFSVREWLEREIRQPEVRGLVEAFFRLSTYVNCPDLFCAAQAVEQLQLALRGNVLYVNGGWGTMVEELRALAARHGAEILSGARVAGVEHTDGVRGVRLADGSLHAAAQVILATTPTEAAALVPENKALGGWADGNRSNEVACLDVALSRLPRPKANFGLGIDEPLYLSVHSSVAKLAPAGGAVIHVAKYLDPRDPGEAKSNERRLEGLLDLLQPGWREVVVERRFLPSMTACHGLVTAAGGGIASRPGPAVPGIRDLYVAGDWVGAEGWLADASCASAKRAAELILGASETSGRAAA